MPHREAAFVGKAPWRGHAGSIAVGDDHGMGSYACLDSTQQQVVLPAASRHQADTGHNQLLSHAPKYKLLCISKSIRIGRMRLTKSRLNRNVKKCLVRGI